MSLWRELARGSRRASCGGATPEKPKRLPTVHSELSRSRPRAQGRLARVGAPTVSIRVEGRAQESQEGRAGRLPWPGAQFYAASHASRRGSRLRAAGVGSKLVFLASQRPRLWTGPEQGSGCGRSGRAQSVSPASRAGPGDSAPLLGRCHAFGTGVIKGLALFFLRPSYSEGFCYPHGESSRSPLGLAAAPF